MPRRSVVAGSRLAGMVTKLASGGQVSVRELEAMLRPHMGQPAWPGLGEPRAVHRARRYAKKYGLWEELGEELSRPREILELKRSFYRGYRRMGDAFSVGKRFKEENERIRRLALGVWLGHPAAKLDDLQDEIWAWCDQWTWTHAPHERSLSPVDMFVTWRGDTLADILVVLKDQLEEEVRLRLRKTLMERVLLAAADPLWPPFWQTDAGLWNFMCNGSLIVIALNLLEDAHVLAAYLHTRLGHLQYALAGHSEDGACLEGASHWEEGFAQSYLSAALCLHHRTGGRLNLVDDPKVQTICRSGLAIHTDGPHPVMFSGAVDRWFDPNIALMINRFINLPEAYWMGPRNKDRTVKVSDWRGLALWRGQKALPGFDRTDYHLPGMAQVTLRAAPPKAAPTVVAAIAGHNDMPHNDNDVGSFMFVRGGRVYLTDPGVHWHTKKSWGPQKYEILYCRSLGHSVPKVNGHEQAPGREHYGSLSVEGLNSGGDRTAVIEMARAYPDATLKKLERRLVFSQDGVLRLTDTYEFSRQPRALEEAFVTFEPVRVARGGRAVEIGKGKESVRMAAAEGTAGRFSVQPMKQFVKEDRWGRVLNRIVFLPRKLAREMELGFVVGG